MSADLSAIEAIAKSWEAACRSLDSERIVAHLADDAVVWYNFEKVEHDRDAYREILDTSAKSFRNQRYTEMRVMHHPEGFVEQATLQGDTDNGVITTPFLLVATVKAGKISRIEEYFDSSIMKQAADA